MMRFAIFAAVSSKPQAAKDKISLPDQIALCRKDGLSRGWHETAGPFVVPGITRTRWVNLRDAETNIPALKQMLDSAQRHEFDVLILYHNNRLRELLDPVDKTLAAYGVQMTSHTSWTEPQPPDEYDPLTDAGRNVRFVEGYTSSAEINELRRRHRKGMKGRTELGYPPSNIRYGYRKPPGAERDSKAIPIPNPITAPVVIRIKDLFLKGSSLWQIADTLTADQVPTPSGNTRWTDVIVRTILKSRFYGGEITYGKSHRTTDPRNGTLKIIWNPPSKYITAKGLHTPLWDAATQKRIDAEWERRTTNYSGKRTQRLSNLLYCGVCGARCYVAYPGGYSEDSRRWACSAEYTHVNRKDSELLPSFIDELVDLIARIEDIPLPIPTYTGGIDPQDTIAELRSRKARLTEAYLSRAMDLEEYTEQKTLIERDLQKEEQKQTASLHSRQRHLERTQTIRSFQTILNRIPSYITNAPAQEVNAQLRTFIQKIIITPAAITIELIP